MTALEQIARRICNEWYKDKWELVSEYQQAHFYNMAWDVIDIFKKDGQDNKRRGR